MDIKTAVFDLTGVVVDLKIEDEKAGHTANAEMLNRAVRHLEAAIGYLEEVVE